MKRFFIVVLVTKTFPNTYKSHKHNPNKSNFPPESMQEAKAYRHKNPPTRMPGEVVYHIFFKERVTSV